MGKKSLFSKAIQLLTHSKDPSPPGLSKYPLVVIGSHMGGLLTYNISNKTHGSIPMMNINLKEDGAAYHIRPLYEQKRVSVNDYLVKGENDSLATTG